MIRRFGFAFALALGLSACTFGIPLGDRGQAEIARVPSTARSAQGNPSSYVVHGKRYYVLDDADDFVQRGIASWYGIKFHGRKTSNGEVYNMHAMTAAHKSLPLPTYVQVKNLDNGRSTVVRVNDRGPFIEGRIIDLSYAAAKKLGVKGPGTARVEIHALRPGPVKPASVVRTLALTDQTERDVPLFIQMGSFSSQINAHNLIQDLIEANESNARITRLQTDDGLFYRVRVGPLYDIEEASAIVRRLKIKGFQTARIVIQEDAD